jgi:hypothetical protein
VTISSIGAGVGEGVGSGVGSGVIIVSTGADVGAGVGSSVGLHTSIYLQRPLSNWAALQHFCRLLKFSEVLASSSYPFEHLVTPSMVMM